MIKLILPVAAFLMVSSASCQVKHVKGEGSRGAKTPAVNSFTAIDIDLPVEADINVQEGAAPSVKLEGYNNVLEHIVAKVEGNKLHIYSDLGSSWQLDCNDVSATITLPFFAALSLSGAPTAGVHGNVKGGDFKLDISGASKVRFEKISVDRFKSGVSGASKVIVGDMAVGNFSTSLSGASKIEVRGGSAQHAKYQISGASKMSAFGLQTEETEASISGAGQSEVFASRKLDANVSGGGSLAYKGHPAVSKSVSGGGSLTEAN